MIRTFILPLGNEVGKVSNSYIDKKEELGPNWMPSGSSYRSKYLQGMGGQCDSSLEMKHVQGCREERTEA